MWCYTMAITGWKTWGKNLLCRFSFWVLIKIQVSLLLPFVIAILCWKRRTFWNIFNPWDSLSRFVSWKQPAFASEVGWHSQGTTPQIRAHFGHVTSAHEWWSNSCSPRDAHLPLDSLSGLSAFVCFSQFVQVFKWKCFCEIWVIVLKGLGRKF